MPGETRILVAVADTPRAVFVKPVGPCKMGICPALREFVETEIAASSAHLYFDLSDAESVDSTFTGFLLSLARQAGGPQGGGVHLFRPSDKVREALATMHVLRFFDVRAEELRPPGKWRTLAASPGTVERAADEVIEAHERLIEADDRNAETFEGVVNTFRTERENKEPPGT